MIRRVVITLVWIAFMVGCGHTPSPTAPTATSAAKASAALASDQPVPFHAEAVFDLQQIAVPPGQCTQATPDGTTVLWMSHASSGDVTITHLGSVRLEDDMCVFGTLLNPGGAPGQNGIPSGWYVDREVWTAANGDQLLARGELVGFTAPPGTPGAKFIESIRFQDGGTGRFEFAEGEGQWLVDMTTMSAVADGWIRYGRK
jgi:hypothetical protein